MSACGNKKSDLKVDTMVGELSASDYHNWQEYEEKVINKTTLDKDEKQEIEDMVAPLENGVAPDKEIEEIKSEYGSIKEYKESLINEAKRNKVRREAYKDVEVTDEDRQTFLNRYSDTFASKNALVFQFNSIDTANEFRSNNEGKSRDEILAYIAEKGNKQEITWDSIESISNETGIELLHNSDSDKYNYCDSETLSGVFDSLNDGKMSDVFEYGGKYTVLIRVSDNTVEKDDKLVDNYMLKIKREEAYKKYIIDNK